MVLGQSKLAADGGSGLGVVARDHLHPYAGGPAAPECIGDFRTRWIHVADDAEQLELTVELRQRNAGLVSGQVQAGEGQHTFAIGGDAAGGGGPVLRIQGLRT